MRKILKIQVLKLFHNAEYTSYNIIGSFLVFAYGWGYSAIFLENLTTNLKEMMIQVLKHGFPALIMLTICLFCYTYVKEFQNKTIYYEKIHGMKVRQILAGRFIVPLMNSCIFCIVLFISEIIPGILYHYLSYNFGIMLLEKTFFSFLIILHLNIVVGAYFCILQDVLTGSIFSFILQWFIPSILISNLPLKFAKCKIFLNSFCCNQFISVWEDKDIHSLLIKQITFTSLIECIVLYFVVYWYYKRKDWN